MKALKALRESELVETNFLVRSSFSGHCETMRIDPVNGREEFIANLLESDVALVVKGDGNFPIRFYEALSLGRIPLLPDTDCVLPLENMIACNRFILRVSYRDLPRVAFIVHDFHTKGFLRYIVVHLLPSFT